MSFYVMVLAWGNIRDAMSFIGPFNTDMDAFAWGEQQDDVHPSWHVLDLDTPPAEPQILPPRMRTPLTSRAGNIGPLARAESALYILCWRKASYHLIGPFD